MKENNKRQRESIRDVEEKRDRLSELSDCVLIYIMEFIDTRDAVRTCVLSKRWMSLWRRLTNLVFDSSQFCNVANFNKFVSCVLSSRDGSFSLRNLKFRRCQPAEPKLLNRLTKYAVLHNVQHCSILFNLNYKTIFELCPVIFSCKSLTFLKLALSTYNPFSMLPKSLKMPALKRLELKCFTFNASESGNGYAEPFSSCKVLDTLILKSCYLCRDAKFLSICNSNLSTLIIKGSYNVGSYTISLSTPSLNSLTVLNHSNHLFSSECNLSFLKEVTIDTDHYTPFNGKRRLRIISWLPVINNVKIMILSWSALDTILKDTSNPDSVSAQHPCFIQLKSLKVLQKQSFHENCISIERIYRALEYILQNSLLDRIDVTFD